MLPSHIPNVCDPQQYIEQLTINLIAIGFEILRKNALGPKMSSSIANYARSTWNPENKKNKHNVNLPC